MSKVLVDRELLERTVKHLEWDGDGSQTVMQYAQQGDSLANELMDCIAQPAEAEGVDFGINGRSVRVSQEAYSIFLDRERYLREDLDSERTRADVAVADANDAERALSAVTAERDRLQRNLNFTEQWYAERFERLADLGKSAGCWDAMAAIIANGTADPYEPPTYAQQLVRANHRADVAERERDQLRAKVEALRKDAVRWRYVRLQGDDTHWLNLLRVDLDEFGGNINAAVDALIDGEAPAMAAKEA